MSSVFVAKIISAINIGDEGIMQGIKSLPLRMFLLPGLLQTD